jgi:outer membrane murein-binding lipoprotein Lpp
MFKAIVAPVLGSILVLCGCSRHKNLTTDELRSELISAKSLAAETEMFLDYVRQKRATKYYAQGHIEYLTDEVERSREELQESSPAQGEEDAVQTLKAQFDALKAELQSVRGRLDDEAALSTAKQHIEGIRRALNEATSSI